MKAHAMTLHDIQVAGLEALTRELGTVGMIRFLQQYETGKGDYSEERVGVVDEESVDMIAQQIVRSREKKV